MEKPKSKGNITSFKSDRFNYNEYWEKQNKEYQKAKERCLFNVTPEFVKNNIYDENGFFYTLEIVEDLIASHNNYNLELTPTAKKQIGL